MDICRFLGLTWFLSPNMIFKLKQKPSPFYSTTALSTSTYVETKLIATTRPSDLPNSILDGDKTTSASLQIE